MNSRKSLYDKQEFYRKGAILKASFQGMRYQVEKWQKDNEEECFRAAIWPEPFFHLIDRKSTRLNSSHT